MVLRCCKPPAGQQIKHDTYKTTKAQKYRTKNPTSAATNLPMTRPSCRQRTCRKSSCCWDAEPSSGSRTAHPVNMASKALVRDLQPPFGHPVVRWSSGCTRTSEASSNQHSKLSGFAQRFQSIQLLCHFWRHSVFVCCVLVRFLRRVRRRSWGLVVDVVLCFQHAQFPDP